jgi:cytochrome c oxidase accessory protein FixG
MREQVCKYMCPYARFQSAMFDKDTMIISYDAERGEPRGTRGRKTDLKAANLGHCIDCELCVQVCPTGIDIRKGLQYECIGCAACIDVCNGVMDKMNYPRGLVRYVTQNGLAQHWSRAEMLRHVLRPRVLIYTGVLVVIVAAMAVSLVLRTPFKVDIVRDRGAMARIVDDGHIENVYRLQIMNATEQPQRFRLEPMGLPQASIEVRGDLNVGPAESRWVPIAVKLPPESAAALGSGTHPLRVRIQRLESEPGAAPREVLEKTTFMVPR